jgi:hypothetical protein
VADNNAVLLLILMLCCVVKTYGMRCLGIPNSREFRNITKFEDAMACKMACSHSRLFVSDRRVETCVFCFLMASTDVVWFMWSSCIAIFYKVFVRAVYNKLQERKKQAEWVAEVIFQASFYLQCLDYSTFLILPFLPI